MLGVSVDEILNGEFQKREKVTNNDAKQTLKFYNQIGTLINIFALIMGIIIANITYKNIWGMLIIFVMLCMGLLIHMISVQKFYKVVDYSDSDKKLIRRSRFEAIVKPVIAVVLFSPYILLAPNAMHSVLLFSIYLDSLIITVPLSVLIVIASIYIDKYFTNKSTYKNAFEIICLLTIFVISIISLLFTEKIWILPMILTGLANVYGAIKNYKNIAWITTRLLVILISLKIVNALSWYHQHANGLFRQDIIFFFCSILLIYLIY